MNDNILLVDDDPITIRLLGSMLAGNSADAHA